MTDRKLTTDELTRDYVVRYFLAPFVFVTRKADNVDGTLEFEHSPRCYFSFQASDPKDRT